MSELDEEKLHYERVWRVLRNIHQDAHLTQLFVTYGPEVFRRSSVLEGFEDFIKSQNFGGKVCIEIGTLKGLTALVLARYFEHVITIDIVDDPQKYEIAESLGVRNVHFVTVKDNAEKAARIKSIAQIDGAFVDGDHARDTQSDYDLVRRCGRVLMHEHWNVQPAVVNLYAGLKGNVVTKDKWALWTA